MFLHLKKKQYRQEQPPCHRDASWYPSLSHPLSSCLHSFPPENRSIILHFCDLVISKCYQMKTFVVASCDWLFSTILWISSRPLAELILHPYLLLSTIPQYVCKHVCIYVYIYMHNKYLYHIFFICSSLDGHLGCFCVYVVVNRAAMNIGCMDLFKLEFLSFPDICPQWNCWII